jgi:hypothetical protein
MAEPTLTEVFGAGATQTATTITILKSDLTGLTASATNRADALLAAILLKSQTFLTKTAFDADVDKSIYFSTGFASFVTRGTSNTSYRVDQMTVNLAKIDTGATLSPNDY